MKQRIVIKVAMSCDKCRKNALTTASKAHGVQSVGIEGEERDQLVVVGDGVDATTLACLLRRKVKLGRADIVKVEEVVAEKAAEPAAGSGDPAAEWPQQQWYPYHPSCYYTPPAAAYPYPYAGHCYVEDPYCREDSWCTIM